MHEISDAGEKRAQDVESQPMAPEPETMQDRPGLTRKELMTSSRNNRMPREAARLTDARSLRSQELLRLALLRLIDSQALEKISLRDIASAAGVSYPTVFKHYDSKDDLFQDIARQQIRDLLAAFRKGRMSPKWRPGEGMCAFINEHRALWRTLLTAGASQAMRSEFIQRGREFARGRPSLGHGFPFELVSGVVAGGIFEIIAWWLTQDADYPVETVSNMLETMVIEPALNLPPGFFTSRSRRSPEPVPAG